VGYQLKELRPDPPTGSGLFIFGLCPFSKL
jgi:hypothetical protein